MRNSDVGLAAVLAAVLAAAVAVEAVAVAQSWGARYWIAGGVAAVVAGGLALLRRRDRRWTAVAGIGVAGVAIAVSRVAELPAEPGPALALALAVLVGSAVRMLPVGWAAAIAGGGLAVVVASFLTERATSSGAAATIAAVVWAGGVATGLAMRVFDTRAVAAEAAVRQQERLDLARELHDVVAHHITGMLIQAQAAHVVARRDPAAVAETLTGIEAAGTEALSAMRRVVGLLRDADDAAPSSAGPENLAELVERFERQGPPVRLSIGDDGAGWPPEVTSTVYRVVREALTNVARHAAGARSVSVTVHSGPSGVTVEVTDDAPAVSQPARSGFGLTGMRERVTSLGGSVDAGPRPGGGWTVSATLPGPATSLGDPR
jgi:signal transduction histidine kinase